MDFADTEDEEWPKKTQRPNRQKAYYVRNPDEKGGPFLFPPHDWGVEGNPPSGGGIHRQADERWRGSQPKSHEMGDFLIDL